ncbi:MAG TPA: EthD family reductase [Bryobacteraceae bacterium]|nr:EthD family reductase [Bryobacteraceae bacterium]
MMICVSVCYPNAAGKKFDHDYYAQKHMPLVMDRYKSFGMIRYEIDTGLAGGAPGSGAPAPFVCIGRLYFNSMEELQKASAAHGAEIFADVPNYTDIELRDVQIQISQTVSS